jgi:small nuclear ribonucleoprotein (snRNP)-like protein
VLEDKRLTDAVVGTLKGYDQLLNLVLDDVEEIMRGVLLVCVVEQLGII